MKVEGWMLKQRQNQPLSIKIRMTENKIRSFYEAFNGKVYVSFSGGKDSTVLLDVVRNIYPDTKAVFVDTGLEHQENRNLVKRTDNVDIIRPDKSFINVLQEYGYPVISKTVSMAISRYRNTKSPIQKKLRKHGGYNPNTGKIQKMGVIPKKWHFLIDAPFKISDKCCDVMKKNPILKYEKETGKHPFIGTMAVDSIKRQQQYMRYGCNGFEKKHPSSTPLGFWTQDDIIEYILLNNLDYSKAYGCFYGEGGHYKCSGEKHTGCLFCMFGVHLEEEPNRFQRMEKENPKLYHYCIDKLGIGNILDYIKIPKGGDGADSPHS